MKRKSLAEERPDLLFQWDRGNTISPFKVSAGSHKKVWWKCNKGHSWEAIVKNRVNGSGCPYCKHRAVLKGYNDLATINPSLAKSWSPKNKLKPSEVSPSSNIEVLWVCETGHEWAARVADRNEGHGCPYCAGHKVWKGYNDLSTTHSELLSEWSDKNELSPDEITYKNRSNVWWHCHRCGNDYQAVVFAKANGRICPYCVAGEIKRNREKRIKLKKTIENFPYFLPQLATIYYAGKRGMRVVTDSEFPAGIPVSSYIPNLRLIIDVCESPKELYIKEYISKVNSIKYVSMPKKLSEEEIIERVIKAFSDSHIYMSFSPAEDLERIRKNYFKLMSNQ